MEFVYEKDGYESESTVECCKNSIYILYLYLDYKICLHHQVADLIIKKKLIRSCSKKVFGVMETASFLIDWKVLPHHDHWSKDKLCVLHNKGFNSVLLTMDRDKHVINSERILRAITSRRAPENENQVKLKEICCQSAAAPDYH